jgi:ATP-dependent DNA helicase RecG
MSQAAPTSRTHAPQRNVTLADPVQFLSGVGPRRAEVLARLGINTAGDLLEYFPLRYERQEARTIQNLEDGMTATIIGRLDAVRATFGRRGRTTTATLIDNTGRCSLAWFNAGWMVDRLHRGEIVQATGKVREHRGLAQIVNPRIIHLDDAARPVNESSPPTFEAIYPGSADLPSRVIGRLITTHLHALAAQVSDWMPADYLTRHKLMPRREAILAIHRPSSPDQSERARRRLAYDELLLMQLAVTLARAHRNVAAKAAPLKCSLEIDTHIRKRFPFTLTAAQDKAIKQIVADLADARPMNRLLQGDVGCGKTAVAMYAALVAIANRRQVALMAPTELLAQQHFRSIERYLDGSRVRCALLVGGLPAARRRELVAQIEQGKLDLVVGTHALIQDDVRFAKLGLVIVDEQHRFGVRQRASIRGKADAPHYLVMTATPIPRTLAMTVFGDLDITTIDAPPPGRVPTQTRVAAPHQHDASWQFVRDRLDRGEQAFVVYPIIDESDKLELRAATSEFERLSKQVFAKHRVALLHGRLRPQDRDRAMSDFAAGKVAVLVATTVVEVGIDVPSATCMVVEHAERYGLSQLHQLRGRIGRGGKPGFCLLLTSSAGAVDNERLGVLVKSTDGFRIAEEDLRLRGPGELIGTRQHGLPELRAASLIGDQDILRQARDDAAEILNADPTLARTQHAALRQRLAVQAQGAFELLNVG